MVFRLPPVGAMRLINRLAWVAVFYAVNACGVAHAATLDIAIIGDRYISQDNFRNDAERVSADLISYEPYATYAGLITFHPIWNQDSLYCERSTTVSRVLTCRTDVVFGKVQAAGLNPYGPIIVLVNDPQYGGSGGVLAVSYNGSLMRPVATHEFQHSFGGLHDEYNLYATAGAMTNTQQSNCWAGVPPPGWSTEEVRQGCRYPNWYRSSPCSLMKDINCRYLNALSQHIVARKLAFKTGVALWPPPPVVTVTAVPSSGVAPLSVAFTATATAPSGGALAYQWTFT